MPNPFNPDGPIISITASTSAPTAVTVAPTNNVGVQQYHIVNTSSTNDVVVGWGANTIQANLAVVNSTVQANCYYLLRASDAVINGPANALFTAQCSASTVSVNIQAGTVVQ